MRRLWKVAVWRTDSDVVEFISYTEVEEALIFVALDVLPRHQDSSVGRILLEKGESEAKRL
jgi:hypothetical protein